MFILRFTHIILYIVTGLSSISAGQADTTRYDPAVRGRPFELHEILGTPLTEKQIQQVGEIPPWVETGDLPSDTIYFGIGRSESSQLDADNQARLAFAQHVEVSVESIAIQQIAENQDRLEENYSFESLVATNMSLRSVKITERYMTPDSTWFSLIRYGKSEYHRLVTEEIQVSLAANIRKQELAHQASEALRADSLRHKITMDSLALARKQAVIDSLGHILQMDEARLRQEQERADLIRSQHAAFLKIKPRFQLIDVPTASSPRTWIYATGRWDPDREIIRQLKTGVSIWLISAETNVWASASVAEQADLMVKLQVLPERGEIYKVSLALGWVNYIAEFSPANRERLREDQSFGNFLDVLGDELNDPYAQDASFFVTATVGFPQYNNHFSAYLDHRKVSVANIWYPFPRNLGDAISVINQLEYIGSESYQNRFEDALQWQLGLRLIAVEDRFATMISYEDHETWMINFEFQY